MLSVPKEYRDLITDLMIKYGQGSETFAIIGAGQCNDVDLRRLCRKFRSITLIDVDSEGMESAINSLSAAERKKIRKKQLALTGISEEDTVDICERILASVRKLGRGITADGYRDILMQALDKAENTQPDKMETYDLILCNGVCSQLFSILSFFLRSLSASVSETTGIDVTGVQSLVDQRFREMNDRYIPEISEMIRNAANQYAIFGNEHSEKNPVEGAYQ